MPKVSVIVPVYNVEKYLKKCLDSLVNQTLEEIEIIVVNDGSPDNSQKIIDEYVKKYPKKVKSFIQKNGGQGSARNLGLTKSQGEYIGYVDSDDYVELDMFEKLYKKACEDNYDIVICGSYNVNEKTNDKIKDLDNIYFEDLKLNAFLGRMAVWNKIYKRDLLKSMKFRSKIWYEDLDFTLKVLAKANKVAYLNEPLYNYLIREGSTMNNSNIKRNLEILKAFDEINNIDMKDEIEFLATDHIYISAIVRVINSKGSKELKNETIKELQNYMFKHYPNFKSNKYLYLLNKRRKIIYKLINLKMYSLINLIFKIKK